MTTAYTTLDELDALERLPDDELLSRLRAMVKQEYASTARLVAHLAEVDARRLYLAEGYASLYLFCLHELHLSEHAAFGRIKAARVARRFPRVLAELAEGTLTLTAIVLLMPHLTGPNHVELIEAARGKTRREMEEMLAARQPLPPADDLLRRLPGGGYQRGGGAAGGTTGTGSDPAGGGLGLFAPSGGAPNGALTPGAGRYLARLPFDSAAAGHDPVRAPGDAPPAGYDPARPPGDAPPAGYDPARPPVDTTAAGFAPGGGPAQNPTAPRFSPPPAARLSPLDAAVYRVQFTARAETYRRLVQVRELMRHQVPDGDLATIFDRALALLYEALARRKFALVMGGKGAPAVAAAAPTEEGAPAAGAAAAGAPAAGPPATGARATRAAAAPKGDTPVVSASALPSDSRAPGAERATFQLVPPEARRRHIPAAVRREVWRRDGGRCAFISARGARCAERGRLEFHHRTPYARGGPATVENLELRCQAHNMYEEPE